MVNRQNTLICYLWVFIRKAPFVKDGDLKKNNSVVDVLMTDVYSKDGVWLNKNHQVHYEIY